jgi:hypothetical protein
MKKYQIHGLYCPSDMYNRSKFIKRAAWTPVEVFGLLEVAEDGTVTGKTDGVYSHCCKLQGKLEGDVLCLEEIHKHYEADQGSKYTGSIIWEIKKETEGCACGWAGTYRVREGVKGFCKDIGPEGILIFSCVPIEE